MLNKKPNIFFKKAIDPFDDIGGAKDWFSHLCRSAGKNVKNKTYEKIDALNFAKHFSIEWNKIRDERERACIEELIKDGVIKNPEDFNREIGKGLRNAKNFGELGWNKALKPVASTILGKIANIGMLKKVPGVSDMIKGLAGKLGITIKDKPEHIDELFYEDEKSGELKLSKAFFGDRLSTFGLLRSVGFRTIGGTAQFAGSITILPTILLLLGPAGPLVGAIALSTLLNSAATNLTYGNFKDFIKYFNSLISEESGIKKVELSDADLDDIAKGALGMPKDGKAPSNNTLLSDIESSVDKSRGSSISSQDSAISLTNLRSQSSLESLFDGARIENNFQNPDSDRSHVDRLNDQQQRPRAKSF
jgi:hypothetical protein